MAQPCPFCQNPVSAGVFQCPHCGRVQYKIRCSRCGNWSFANSDSCRSCGGPFSPEDQASRYVIEPNDPIMRDIAPTMAPIPRRSVQQQQPAAPPQPQAPPIVVVQPQAPVAQPGGQPVIVMERPSYRPEKSYLGEAFLAWVLYYVGFVPGLIANILFLSNARRDERQGIITRNVGCLQILLWFHIIAALGGCAFFIFFNGLAIVAAMFGSK